MEDGVRPQVLQNLVKDIKAHGNRLTTGDVGNRYLFQTLARNGLNELMYTMHNHEEAPGYGFQLKFGYYAYRAVGSASGFVVESLHDGTD